MSDAGTLVLGVGAAYRGDDQAGLRVAEQLASRVPDGVKVATASGEGTALLAALEGYSKVFVVDACSGGGPLGSYRRLDYPDTSILPELRCSTHEFGVAEALALGKVLGQLPDSVTLYAIEGRYFRLGDALTPSVAAAAEEVANAILAEIAVP